MSKANRQSYDVICDVTGFKRKRKDVSYRWDGCLVLPMAWDPLPAYMIPPNTTDDISVPDARPDQPAVFISPTPADLNKIRNF